MLFAGLVQNGKENSSIKAALKPMALLRTIAVSPDKAKCIIQQAIAFRESRRPPRPAQAKAADVKRSRKCHKTLNGMLIHHRHQYMMH
jgi:hypothetical protein